MERISLHVRANFHSTSLRSGKSVVVRPLKPSPSQSFSVTYGLLSDKQISDNDAAAQHLVVFSWNLDAFFFCMGQFM